MSAIEIRLWPLRFGLTPSHKHGADVTLTHEHQAQSFDAVIGVHAERFERKIEALGKGSGGGRVVGHGVPGELADVILSTRGA